MSRVVSYVPDVTPAAFGADPGPWYTFVGDEAFPLNRKLDHLFTNRSWAPGTVQVLQDAVLLSDHVPVVAGWQVVPSSGARQVSAAWGFR